MFDAIEITVSALVLGLAAGLSPGPLMALMLREALAHGVAAGARVAIAPLLSDAPVIALTLAGVGASRHVEGALAVLSLLGGAFLLYLAWQTMTLAPPRPGEGRAGTLGQAMLVNLLNPAPWLFWFGIGLPLLAAAARAGWQPVALFLLVFYTALVGSKLCLAVLTARGARHLDGRAWRLLMRFLGALLAGMGALLLRDGMFAMSAG